MRKTAEIPRVAEEARKTPASRSVFMAMWLRPALIAAALACARRRGTIAATPNPGAPAMSPELSSPVQPCFRCGQPAEKPAVGMGHVAGKDQDNEPLCVQCLGLLLSAPAAFVQG